MKNFIFFLGLALSIFSISDASPETNNNKVSIRYFSYPDYTRIVLEFRENITYTTTRLADPERIAIDINKTIKGIPPVTKIDDSVVEQLRTGYPEKTKTRFVVDLKGRSDYIIFSLYDPFRIVMDIRSEKQGEENLRERKMIHKRPHIIIDPGHGGHDPGAIGKNGLQEKDVNLDIALRVRDLLRDEFEITMTRDRDIFISLEERTSIANSKKADLFISIHTNSNRKRHISGVETYFLNWTDDEEALKVAARENGMSIKALREFMNKNDIVEMIMMDLERNSKRELSMRLASLTQNELINTLKRYSNGNGIKKGPFYVLYTAKMPSVLIEVSYISNPVEERLLSTTWYRQEIAKAIANAIRRFFNQHGQEEQNL